MLVVEERASLLQAVATSFEQVASQKQQRKSVLRPFGRSLPDLLLPLFLRWKLHSPLLGRRVRYSCGWPNCIGFGAILFETSVGSQNLRLLGFREETRVTACVACVQEQTCARSEGNYVPTHLGLSVLRRTLSNVALSSSTKSP